MIVDLSSDDAHPIDYAAAKAAGVTGVFVKATEGMGYTNPYFHEDVAGFQAVGVPVLGYHFASFGDVNAEVAHFKSVAGPLARVLDSETSTDANWQNAFLSALGLWPTQRCNYGSASTLPRTASLLWVADYGANPGFGDCWQFTDAGTVAGISGDVDISAWTGSTANFDSLFNIASPPVPPKPPAPPVPKEDEMPNAVVLPNGDIKIYAAGAGDRNNHLLEFTRKDGSQTNEVIDITAQIGGPDPYTVQP